MMTPRTKRLQQWVLQGRTFLRWPWGSAWKSTAEHGQFIGLQVPALPTTQATSITAKRAALAGGAVQMTLAQWTTSGVPWLGISSFSWPASSGADTWPNLSGASHEETWASCRPTWDRASWAFPQTTFFICSRSLWRRPSSKWAPSVTSREPGEVATKFCRRP